MPRRMKRSSKKYGKRRFARKMRPRRGLRQPVQYFKRVVYGQGQIVVDPTVETNGAIVFSLAQVPNHTEFTSLYDQYKISAVKVRIMPRFNSVEPSDAGTSGLFPYNGQLFTAIDYDDSGISSVNDILQYQNCKTTRLTSIHQRYFKPAARGIVQDITGAATARMPIKGFIDSADDQVLHYCLKYSIPQFTNAAESALLKFDVITTYYLAMKNVR